MALCTAPSKDFVRTPQRSVIMARWRVARRRGSGGVSGLLVRTREGPLGEASEVGEGGGGVVECGVAARGSRRRVGAGVGAGVGTVGVRHGHSLTVGCCFGKRAVPHPALVLDVFLLAVSEDSNTGIPEHSGFIGCGYFYTQPWVRELKRAASH